MEDSVPQEDKTRLRVKFGAAEIDYEGSSATLEKLIMPTVAKMIDMVEAHADLQRGALPPQAQELLVKTLPPPVEPLKHSTNTIAVHLKVESGPDLAMAAAAHLALVKGQAHFTRKQILDEMKSATGFYKTTMSNNLSSSLTGLTTNNRLHLVAQDTYALPNDERARLEKMLAQIK